MRKLCSAVLLLGVVACQTVTGPTAPTEAGDQGPDVAFAASPSACQGQIIAGIANTWPWAHDDRIDFPPPPGAIALWIQLFGPDAGISSVRELQALFCT